MSQASAKQKLAMVALLIAAFVVIPVANTTFCALEDTTFHVSQAADGDGHSGELFDEGLRNILDGHCDHGHCHHASAQLPVDTFDTDLPRFIVHQWPDPDVAISYIPDELTRPPKA